VRRNRTQAVDLAVSLRVQAATSPPLGRLMWAVSQPGFPPLSRVIPGAIVAVLWRSGHRLEAGLQLVAWSAALVAEGLKLLVDRPRPLPPAVRVTVASLGGSSFPSGHVLGYVGVYGFAAHLANSLVRPTWPRRVLLAPAVGLIALVGPSRVYLGHHWPTDVVASYLLGFAWLTGLTALHRRLRGEAAA
jgi:undecaprenyl-diphosphatase